MREIKFRAWDVKNKQMVIPDYISDGYAFMDVAYESPEYFDSILMQYTGLKDKNDKEIYEGDIVKWYKNNHYNNCGGNCDFDRIEEVKYYDYGFEPFIFSDGYNGIIMIDYNECEVIGNIYENKNLLQNGK